MKKWIKTDFKSRSASRVLDSFLFEAETEVDRSCSVVLADVMWVFGGTNKRRQLSSVRDCSLRREGKLPFDFYLGACNTIGPSETAETALLCFDYSTSPYTSCHR